MTLEQQLHNTAHLLAQTAPAGAAYQNHNLLTDAHTRLAKAHNRLREQLTEANRLTEEIAGYVAAAASA
jgi:hypothetical protein